MVSIPRVRLLSQLTRLVRHTSEGSGADEQEFQRLYRSAYGFVRQRARALLRDEEEALDAAQEAFLRGWEHWPSLSGAESPVGWLIVTVTRICIDRRRRRRPGDTPQEDVPAASPTSAHLARLLRLRLEGERPLRLQVAIHTWVDGMTQEETAALLGISRKTVQRQLAAFRERHARDLADLAEVSDGD